MTDDESRKSKMVFEYTLTINGEVKIDKPVKVRYPKELNGIINNYHLEIGDMVEIRAKRIE